MTCRLAVVLVLLLSTMGAAAGGAAAVPTAEDTLKSADRFLKSREYAKAQELYRSVYLAAPKGPQAARALLGSAKAYFRLRRFQEARLTIQRLQAANPRPEYLNEAYLMLGYIALYSPKVDEAAQYFEKVHEPLHEKALIARAEVALKRGDMAGAESLLQGLGKRTAETDPRALAVRAMVYSRKGMHTEAIASINKVLDPVLKEEDLRPEKVEILFNAGRLGDADRVGQTIMKNPLSQGERRRAARLLARIYEMQGRVETALKLNLEILPYETDDGVKMSIVRLYERQGDTGSALKYLNLLKDRTVKAAEIEKRLRHVVASGSAKDIELLTKYSGYLSPDSSFTVQAARFLLAQGKRAEGTRLLKSALMGLAGGEAAVHLAEVYLADERYEETKKLLEPVALDTRYFVRASALLAETHRRQGSYAQAIRYLERAVRRSADSRLTTRLGDIYWESGDRATAVKYYAKASAKGDGSAALKAGDYYYLTGNTAQARTFYKRALTLGAGNPETLQWARYQYGKLSGNKEYLRKAAEGGGIVGSAATVLAGEE
ncbi:MAG: tetratricopeptide repeat protein [Nitrospirota bacterium]